jgi:Zn-dependent protease with chaperone function
LPFRLLWTAFHLLRLRESRAAECAADRVAIHAYGPATFINALSGTHVVERTLHGTAPSLRQEMHKHNNPSFYAELRRHYAELPPALLSKLRTEAVREFRSMERSHPITPDRLRAAYMLIAL